MDWSPVGTGGRLVKLWVYSRMESYSAFFTLPEGCWRRLQGRLVYPAWLGVAALLTPCPFLGNLFFPLILGVEHAFLVWENSDSPPPIPKAGLVTSLVTCYRSFPSHPHFNYWIIYILGVFFFFLTFFLF